MSLRLRETVQCVLKRDPAARNTLEVLLFYPGVHALVLHQAAHACWIKNFKFFARCIAYFSRWLTGIEIHPAAHIGQRVFIDHGMGVVIGETAVVGDDCTIYQGVTLGGTSLHRGVKRHPTLGKGVVVGAGAKVLGGFAVGDCARIGSNAVVVKEVPAHAVAIGVPARIVEAAGSNDASTSSDPGSDTVFSAYGLDPNADDPLTVALHRLIHETADQQKTIEALLAALQAHGIQVSRAEGSEHQRGFDGPALDKLID